MRHNERSYMLAAFVTAASLLLLSGCGDDREPAGVVPPEPQVEEPVGTQSEAITSEPAERFEAEAPVEPVKPPGEGAMEASPETTTQEAEVVIIEPETETTAAAEGTQGQEGQQGQQGQQAAGAQTQDVQALLRDNGCAACHAVNAKQVGPAYSWIAHRYQGQSGMVDTLVGRVKDGAQGHWTDITGGVPMPPNPQLSDEKARTMVEWILNREPSPPPQS